MRRLLLLAGALVVPVLIAAPAQGVDNIICVNNPGGACDQNFLMIAPAIAAANANTVADTIRVAAGSYNDGPYQLNGSSHAITLEGAGQGATILSLPASATNQTYLFAGDATVKGLTIQMVGTNSQGDTGLSVQHSVVDHVTVDGPAIVNATGVYAATSTISNSVVLTPPSQVGGTRAMFSSGGNTVTDTSLTGSQGLNLSDPGTVDNVSRVSIRADDSGVTTDGGTVNIDDSVIDLGTSANGTGLGAVNFNNGPSAKTINANHVTIVGGGAGARGVWAYAAADGVKTTATVTLSNSIVRGPNTSLVAEAGNDGAQGGPSTATVTASYSDYQSVSNPNLIGPNGAGGVVVATGNLVGVDPLFVNAAGGNYRLAPASPVVDKGDPAAGGPTLDRDGGPRVLDGDPVVGAVRDMGAYELPAIAHPAAPDTTAPETTMTKKPAKKITKKKVKLAFSSEAGATFQCQVDGKAWRACTSPLKLKVKVGKHVVLVRAIDAAGNADATPAKVKFKRVAPPR